MNLVRPGGDPIKFMSSPELDASQDKDLLSVAYTRVQRESPEFNAVYEGIEQKVDVKISTFIFSAAPEPVITLYDFIMTTFVPQNNTAPLSIEQQPSSVAKTQSNNGDGKIHVTVHLASVQG